jgi:hypothetical protein
MGKFSISLFSAWVLIQVNLFLIISPYERHLDLDNNRIISRITKKPFLCSKTGENTVFCRYWDCGKPKLFSTVTKHEKNKMYLLLLLGYWGNSQIIFYHY